MSGSTPFTARSPTQSNQYPPYSPSHPNRPYFGHEPFQIPPPQHLMQTPPPFQPASLVHSPHQHRQSSLASPLPAPNALPPPPPPPPVGNAPGYAQPLNSSPPFSLQRSYPGHLVPPTMPPQYDGTSSHAHPPGPPASGLQSPIRDHHSLSNGRLADNHHTESRPQSKEVRPHAGFVKENY